ncbi:unnamed protein product [Lampetra planeri]
MVHAALAGAVSQRAPVCSVVGKTFGNECLLHKESCRKRRRTGLAHPGPCLGKHTALHITHVLLGCSPLIQLSSSVPKENCTAEELGQFPYRLLDWFLLLSRMGRTFVPGAPPRAA